MMRARLIATAAVAIAVAGCFKSSPPATESVTPTTTVSSASIFPHKSNWSDPTQHGLYVKDALGMDVSTCLGCHGETGTVNGGAPSCRSCHKNFPHTEPGITLETHGAFIIANGKSACATQCHGTDLKGGLSGVACTQCHSNYPHANAWSTPSVHGPFAQGMLKNNCTSCHGTDLKGGTSKVSCYTCHKETYPHPQGWSAPDQHGKFVQQNGTGKCATQCHGVQLEGGLSGVSCKTCHNVWPHPATGWMAQHGSQARLIGINGCMGCHKATPPGGQTGVSCTSCHATLPAHTDADWGKSGHGKLVKQQPTSLTDPKGCPLCHGAKLEGGKAPTVSTLKPVPACASCHKSYPQLHKPAAGAPAWSSFDGHGKWVMGQVDISKGGVPGQINTLLAECKLCHGDDLQGGNTGKGCYNNGCHVSFPHPPAAPGYSPWISKHGIYANSETPKAKSCAGANCHGIDLQGIPAGEKEVSKKLVKGCADCHLQMPHLPKGQWDHGQSALIAGTTQLDVTKCSQCHGDAWKGKSDAPSCYQCHDTYPLPHRSDDGKTNPAWKPATGHGDFVMATYTTGSVKNTAAAPCKTCHGSDLTGGASGKTCYKCHKSFPHPAGPLTVNGLSYVFADATWNGFDKGHGQYVIARAAANNVTPVEQVKTECAQACHGSDLKGGTSKKSCVGCHHQQQNHGAAAAAAGANCKSCHGPDLAVGNAMAPGCVSCHGPGKSLHKTTIKETVCSDPDNPDEPPWKCDQVVPYSSPTLHGEHAKAVATANPKTNMLSCRTCHGDDFKGGISGKSCYSCHNPGGKYPHTKLGPATLDIWRQQSATQTVPSPKTLSGNMWKNCYTACHDWMVFRGDGKKVFEVFPDMKWSCMTCHTWP